jgi:hypothetical protein
MRKTMPVVTAALAVLSALALPSRAAGPAPCVDWPVTLGADGVNAGGPDTSANYWVTHYEGPARASLLIRGTYPTARFFSLAVQDTAGTTLASLRDDRLDPDRGSVNPFRSAARQASAQHYTATIDFGNTPARPAPNTIYAGRTLEGEPNVAGTLIYRVYVPTDQRDRKGGAPLPSLSLRVPGGEVPLSFVPGCSALPPNVSAGLNATVDGVSRPSALPASQPSNKVYADPNFVRVFAGQLYEPVTNSLPAAVAGLVPPRKGIPLQNADFPYLMSSVARAHGEAVVVRFRPPTFPDTVRGRSVLGRHQVRYWSVCTFSDTTEGALRTNGCLVDWRTAAGPDGWVRILVTDTAHKPASMPRGVHWLNWGPTADDLVFFRVGVPAPSWSASPLRIDPKASDQVAAAARTMGAYYPLARSCAVVPTTLASFDSCVARGFGAR